MQTQQTRPSLLTDHAQLWPTRFLVRIFLTWWCGFWRSLGHSSVLWCQRHRRSMLVISWRSSDCFPHYCCLPKKQTNESVVLQHKGAMSTKPVFKKIAELQRSYAPLCGHTTFVLLTVACTRTISDKITIFCNDVNKTSTSVELLAINILLHVIQK